ncbi:MAG: efflux RND transporter periplasmic adaptor subunit [Acidobacteria bacterium]|nr:efflux RND transporter periplasmic adaptor subunit [Acidobacteriota bacterium]
MVRSYQPVLQTTCKYIKSNMLWGFLAVFILGSVACKLQPPPETSGTAGVETPGSAAAVRGNFKRIVRLNGRVSAVESFSVQAPRLARQTTSTMIITKILPTGTWVEKGAILVELDRQNQLKNVLDRQAEYDSLVQQIKKKRADQTAALAADQTELKEAEVDLQTAKVEMRKNEVIPKYQAAINIENLKEAEAKLEQLRNTFALKREAEAADLRILEIQRDRAEKSVFHEQNNIEKMTIRSPMSGLVVLTPISKGTRMLDPEEGDEVRSGGGIMLVVNPSAMQVSARLNQVDVSQVRIGQPAEIHLDAYPDLHFAGRLEHISAIGIQSDYSNRIRNFNALISIQGSNSKLLPDLTAAVDVVLEACENVLLLPRNAVVFRENRAFVEVLENGGSEVREVETGSMNNFEIIIQSGLDEGTIVTRDPEIPPGRDI